MIDEKMFFFNILFETLNAVIPMLFQTLWGKVTLMITKFFWFEKETVKFFLLFFIPISLCFYNLFSFFNWFQFCYSYEVCSYKIQAINRESHFIKKIIYLEKLATKFGHFSSIIKIDRVVTDEKDCKRYSQEDDNIAFQNHNPLKWFKY